MRPVLHGDVVSAARALLTVPEAARAEFCATLIQRADMADKHCRQTGQVHLMWGNGSLMAAARTHRLPSEPSFENDIYCSCFEMVLQMLVKWRVSQRRN
jgi:hypothetical protein